MIKDVNAAYRYLNAKNIKTRKLAKRIIQESKRGIRSQVQRTNKYTKKIG